MSDRLYFTYERLPPLIYPEPRDVRNQLMTKFCNIYNNKPLSEILLSTEFIIKSIKSKDPSKADRPLLRYKVISIDWEDIRHEDKVLFNRNTFRFSNIDEQNYE